MIASVIMPVTMAVPVILLLIRILLRTMLPPVVLAKVLAQRPAARFARSHRARHGILVLEQKADVAQKLLAIGDALLPAEVRLLVTGVATTLRSARVQKHRTREGARERERASHCRSASSDPRLVPILVA